MIQYFRCKNKFLGPARNENGFALITVLVLSAVLMATMAIVMNSSTMELVMSGASSVSKMALARADAGVEYVRGTFDLVNYGTANAFDPTSPDEITISNDYLSSKLSPPSLIDSTDASYSLKVSQKKNNSLLTGRGFSNKSVSSSSGGGGMTLSAYPCDIRSTGTVANYSKTVEVEGFTLAP